MTCINEILQTKWSSWKASFLFLPQYFKVEQQVPCVENGSICGPSKGFTDFAELRGF